MDMRFLDIARAALRRNLIALTVLAIKSKKFKNKE
jgi:hypothetical protein